IVRSLSFSQLQKALLQKDETGGSCHASETYDALLDNRYVAAEHGSCAYGYLLAKWIGKLLVCRCDIFTQDNYVRVEYVDESDEGCGKIFSRAIEHTLGAWVTVNSGGQNCLHAGRLPVMV